MSGRGWNQKQSEYIRSAKPRAKYVIVKLAEDMPTLYLAPVSGAWTPLRSAAMHFDSQSDARDELVALRDARGKLAPRMRVQRFVVDVDPVQAAARRG